MKFQDQPKIRVVVRKRPLNKKQILKAELDVVQVKNQSSVIVRQMKQKVDLTKFIDQHHFNFDSAFDQTMNNEQIYQQCVKPIVQCAFLGARVTCFAYGQTGSGKTYTMNGDTASRTPGMYVLGAQDIFNIKQQPQFKNLTVSMSFYQIYCGKLYDLLNNRQVLQAREDAKQNVNIIGLTQKKIMNVYNFMQVIDQGSSVRITSQNSTNADSSRSHAILQITLMDGKKIFGKISFIDLAGCERGADTIDQNKQTRIDGAQINKSLLALKQCIRALDNGKSHTPFRGSKLTMVLKDSFTGFCRTLMIGNISPNSSSCQNTLNTLRYADRVKQLKKPSNQFVSKQDQLAKELMLPRMMKNKQTVQINSDGQQQIQQKIVSRKVTEIRAEQEVPQLQKIKTQRDGLLNQHLKKKQSIGQNNQNVNRYYEQKRGVSAANHKNNNRSNQGQSNNIINNLIQINQKNKALNLLNSNTGNQKANTNNLYSNQIKSTPQLFKPIQNKNKKQSVTKIQSDSFNYPQLLQNSQYNQWEQILQEFRGWNPKDQTQIQKMSSKFEGLVNYIMREQMEVLELHKSHIQSNSTFQSQQLKLYNDALQQDKTNEQFLNYAQNLQQIVDKRITQLINLKNKLGSYKYHLKQHESCQKKLFKASQQLVKLQQQTYLFQQIPSDEFVMPLNPTIKLFQNNFYHQTQPILNDLQNQLQNYNSNQHPIKNIPQSNYSPLHNQQYRNLNNINISENSSGLHVHVNSVKSTHSNLYNSNMYNHMDQKIHPYQKECY